MNIETVTVVFVFVKVAIMFILNSKLLLLFNLFFLSYPSEKNNLSFIETSALDSTNVEEAFKNILTGKVT